MRACTADSACGAGGARPFLRLRREKTKTRTFCKRRAIKIRKNVEINRPNVLKYSLSRLKTWGTKEEEKGMKTVFEKVFQLSKHKTTAKTEVMAGITTFMTMAYILAVNPSMLAAAGMDKTAVLMATCIASFIGTLAMAMLANYPFALAPGMGLNAYFAYTVCGAMGYDWKIALMAVFAEGLIFIVLSLTNVREAIFNAIPTTLKKGVSVGIGFFIAFLGLQDGHIVVNNDSTLVTIVDFTGDFHTLGIGAILALIGLFIISILYIRGVKGAILIGIAATWILGMIAQAAGLYIPDAEAGFYSLYPVWGAVL